MSPTARSGSGCVSPAPSSPIAGEAILQAVSDAGYSIRGPGEISDEELTAVHSPELIDFLRRAQQDWARSGYPTDPGQEKVVPYSFPHPDLLCGEPLTIPVSVGARTGMYAMDTMTLIGPGTWEAVRAAAACALTAADIVAAGERIAYAAVQASGPPCRSDFLWRCVLCQQRRSFRAPPFLIGSGGGDRYRCPSRQRHPANFLRHRSSSLRLGAHRPRRRILSALGGEGSSSAEPARAAAPTSTCRCRQAPETTIGSTRSGSWSSSALASKRLLCHLASTRLSMTPRVPCRSASTGTIKRGV